MHTVRVRVLLAGVALTTAACGGGATAQPLATPRAPATVATPSTAPVSTEASAAPQATPDAAVGLALLRKVAIRRADLPAGYSGDSMQEGDLVVGQVTLDMCGATFKSEAFRTARHQVAFSPGSDRQPPVSNEVVAYASPARAAMAMAEIRHAAAHCPKGPVTSSVASMPATLQRVTVLPKSAQLPASSIRLAMTLIDPKTKKTLGSELVFTVRGSVLSGTYVIGLGAAPAALSVRLAKIVALRVTKAIP